MNRIASTSLKLQNIIASAPLPLGKGGEGKGKGKGEEPEEATIA